MSLKNKLLNIFMKKVREVEPRIEDGNNEEYLEKCFRDYLNDNFVIEQSLFLFSYLIKKNLAWSFTNDIGKSADSFIDIGWIDSNGTILITANEANRFVDDNIGEINDEALR